MDDRSAGYPVDPPVSGMVGPTDIWRRDWQTMALDTPRWTENSAPQAECVRAVAVANVSRSSFLLRQEERGRGIEAARRGESQA